MYIFMCVHIYIHTYIYSSCRARFDVRERAWVVELNEQIQNVTALSEKVRLGACTALCTEIVADILWNHSSLCA